MPRRSRRYSAEDRRAYRAKIHAYLQTPEWKLRSINFRRTKRFKCYACGHSNYANHAHHLTYERAFSGQEPDSDLMCLCPPCHREVHRFARDSKESLRIATARTVRAIQARNAPRKRGGLFRRKRRAAEGV